MNSKRFRVATIYKPPTSDCVAFTNTLTQMFHDANTDNIDNFVLGDFNIDLLHYETHNGTQHFLNSLNSLSLIPTISKPTRISEQGDVANGDRERFTATLIDNIFLDKPVNFVSGILTANVSDHLPVFLMKTNFFTIPHNESYRKEIKYRRINEANLQNLYVSVSRYNFEEMCMDSTCDEAIENIYNVIFREFNNCCPIKSKTVSHKNLTKPWISEDIRNYIRKKEAYFILLKQNKLPIHFYRRYRNFVTNQIRNAKKKYYSDLFTRFNTDVKATWQAINKILRPNSDSSKKSITKIIYNNDVMINEQAISEAFNEFFANVGRNIAEEQHPLPSDHLKFLTGDHLNSFFFRPILVQDIQGCLLSLKNKSSHINSIPVAVLKYLANLISPSLTILVNNSLTTGVFPTMLKQARIIPIPKGGDMYDVNNYRPISILHVFSKIFEKIVHRQLINFLEQFNILYNNQFGFRNKKSTVQAILRQLQYLYNELDSGKSVISIFLDFKKAFDCVDHEILLSKLQYYGIRGTPLKWFSSYLTNRQQFTVIGDSLSSSCIVSHGVPQGSILGPLLFLVFINDLPNASNLFKYTLFADDSTLSASFNRNDDIAGTINAELVNVNSWLKANKICINANKTKYILFTYRKNIVLPPILINNDRIGEVNHIKFLGILFDKNLTFKNHVDYISAKVSRSIGVIYKLSFFLPTNILHKLYYSLIQPYLLYGIEAWFSTYRSITNKITVLQKKACRAVNNLKSQDHTTQYFRMMGALKLQHLYEYQIATYIYKTINNDHDAELLDSLNLNMDMHSYYTRNRNNWRIPAFKRGKSQFSIQYTGVKFWNELSSYIRNATTVSNFKSRLRNDFFFFLRIGGVVELIAVQ